MYKALYLYKSFAQSHAQIHNSGGAISSLYWDEGALKGRPKKVRVTLLELAKDLNCLL
jgi:hypothetical protein